MTEPSQEWFDLTAELDLEHVYQRRDLYRIWRHDGQYFCYVTAINRKASESFQPLKIVVFIEFQDYMRQEDTLLRYKAYLAGDKKSWTAANPDYLKRGVYARSLQSVNMTINAAFSDKHRQWGNSLPKDIRGYKVLYHILPSNDSDMAQILWDRSKVPVSYEYRPVPRRPTQTMRGIQPEMQTEVHHNRVFSNQNDQPASESHEMSISTHESRPENLQESARALSTNDIEEMAPRQQGQSRQGAPFDVKIVADQLKAKWEALELQIGRPFIAQEKEAIIKILLQ